MLTQIRKRDGRITAFKNEKITWAIFKAATAVGGNNWTMAEDLTRQVIELANKKYPDGLAEVEGIQDLVEKVLAREGPKRAGLGPPLGEGRLGDGGRCRGRLPGRAHPRRGHGQ